MAEAMKARYGLVGDSSAGTAHFDVYIHIYISTYVHIHAFIYKCIS